MLQIRNKNIDAHQAFEEIRGVIAADASGTMTRDEYRALGVRQSIFAEDERDRLYDLFDKYRAWLNDSTLFDLNLIAHDWRALARPQYDFVVIDEVQDMTTAQLALVLKALKKPDQFLLCGDSNQIVHPNFFHGAKSRRCSGEMRHWLTGSNCMYCAPTSEMVPTSCVSPMHC